MGQYSVLLKFMHLEQWKPDQYSPRYGHPHIKSLPPKAEYPQPHIVIISKSDYFDITDWSYHNSNIGN